jgi:hypothetical protein
MRDMKLRVRLCRHVQVAAEELTQLGQVLDLRSVTEFGLQLELQLLHLNSACEALKMAIDRIRDELRQPIKI